MTFKEIIAKEGGKYIFSCICRAFWVCKEQIAYSIFISRTYKAVNKFIKNCNQAVVFVVFSGI